jgi:uncharacterized protein YkvS
MKHTLRNNGDALEKAYSNFINDNFKTYEIVWQNYIGNDGNNVIATIIGYDSERNKKRKEFSEHTYTILQSIILLKRLVEKYEGLDISIKSIEDILDFQDLLMLFFGHVGRINDNLNIAELCLINKFSKESTTSLNSIYHKRHLIIHGKTLPFIFDETGNVLIPVLGTNTNDRSGWYHKQNSWDDINNLKSETIEITIKDIYINLLQKLNHIFGLFNKDILNELEQSDLQIDYPSMNSNPSVNVSLDVSGSTSIGNFGSSGFGTPPKR